MHTTSRSALTGERTSSSSTQPASCNRTQHKTSRWHFPPSSSQTITRRNASLLFAQEDTALCLVRPTPTTQSQSTSPCSTAPSTTLNRQRRRSSQEQDGSPYTGPWANTASQSQADEEGPSVSADSSLGVGTPSTARSTDSPAML